MANNAHLPGVGPVGGDFWAIWLRHRHYLYTRCVRWLGGDRNDAEDVLSKGAVNAAIHMRDHPGVVREFRPWILRVLHNLCIDHMRARSRIVAKPAVWDAAPAPGWVGCPDAGVRRAEIGRAIERAAGCLQPHLRRIFALRFADDLPYAEISEVLDITPENARKRVQQARGQVREALQGIA